MDVRIHISKYLFDKSNGGGGVALRIKLTVLLLLLYEDSAVML